MKSLKSRLRRQDAPGPAPSGAAAAAAVSAVSSVASARPERPALPSREPQSLSLLGFPSVSRWVGPGDSSSRLRPGLRVGPETPGDPPRRCLQGSPVPFPHPSPLGLPAPGL